jgi:hypothetical protein
VQDATDERVKRLCQQAACEQDAIELVGEISRLPEEKRARARERGRVEEKNNPAHCHRN